MATPIKLPNTDYLILHEDSAHSLSARQQGSIITEHCLLNHECIQALKPGDIVYDVGAYVGDTARYFLNKGCRVTAFEPFPDAFECLKNNCPEATCVNAVVGDGCGVTLLDTCDEIYPWHANNFGTRRVLVDDSSDQVSLRLDDGPSPGRVALLKIDVEGFEGKVIRGAKQLIECDRPIILFEAFNSMLQHYAWTREMLLSEICALGYRFEVAVGSSLDDRVDYVAYPR
jgi:FkbM family methyltransferase